MEEVKAHGARNSALRWLASAMAVALAFAAGEMPDSYYQFLRVSVTAGSLWLAYLMWQDGRYGLFTFCSALAAVFNPAWPVELDRDEWLPIDLGAAAILVFVAWGNRSYLPRLKTHMPWLGLVAFAVVIGVAVSTQEKPANESSYDLQPDGYVMENVTENAFNSLLSAAPVGSTGNAKPDYTDQLMQENRAEADPLDELLRKQKEAAGQESNLAEPPTSAALSQTEPPHSAASRPLR